MIEGSSSLLSCSSSSFNSYSNVRLNSVWPYNCSLRKWGGFVTSVTKLNGTSNVLIFCHGAGRAFSTSRLAMERSKRESVPSAAVLPKIDKSGRFCSPRAARELALLIAYAACIEGSDPIHLFEKRMNVRREPDYEFDKETLLVYDHMTFGGPPVTTKTVEEANDFLHNDEKESAIEAEVLSAPPKLVYNKLILRFTRKLLVAIVDRWDSHVAIIDKVSPENWKKGPAGRILELCILHLAMSEISVIGTAHQIVINEAVDLAKRFCDGAAPRIINGCLRTFMKDHHGQICPPQPSEATAKVS